MIHVPQTSHHVRWILCAVLILLISILIALNLGSSGVSFWSLADGDHALASQIIWQTRWPRILLAGCAGYALSLSGATYQTLLHNPLADPYLLGVAGGAGLGSALGLACGLPLWGTLLLAFGMSLATMQLLLWWTREQTDPLPASLLLTGAACNAFTFAIILLIQSMLPVAASQQLLFLLMGTFTSATAPVLAGIFFACLLGTALILPHAAALDILGLGRETAVSLGIDVPRIERRLFIAGSLLVGSAVAVSGLVGFVGLFVPHAVRLCTGQRHQLLLPISGFIGAAFLILADTAARSLLSLAGQMTELPIGAVTALIGAPCFVWLLRRMHIVGGRA